MTVLIHLVSAQRMQNLLPILGIKPDLVIQIRSESDPYVTIAKHIENAVHSILPQCKFKEVEAPSPFSPSLKEIRNCVTDIARQYSNDRILINITGGTKIMSLGAYLASETINNLHPVYWDTAQKNFFYLNECDQEVLPSFSSVVSRLDIMTVLAAHGNSNDDWKCQLPQAHEIEFAHNAYQFISENPDFLKDTQFPDAFRKAIRGNKNSLPKNKKPLEDILATDLLAPFKSHKLISIIQDFLRIGVHAGLLEECPNSDAIHIAKPMDESISKDALRKYIQHISNIINGSWIELYVFKLLKDSEDCLDIKWSVEPTNKTQSEKTSNFGETDILFLNKPQGNLHIISCKTSLNKPLEHLESLSDRARHLGGSHAQALLYILAPKTSQIQDLINLANFSNVTLVIGDEVKYFSDITQFPRKRNHTC